MIRVVLHPEGLSIAIRVLESRGHQIILNVDAPVVAQRERPVPGCVLDRPPQVDDLIPVLQELRNVFCGKMSVDTRQCGSGSLVDMDLGNRLPLLWAVVNLAWSAATNGCEQGLASMPATVEAEDVFRIHTVVKQHRSTCTGEFFQELNALWIVLLLDLFVGCERGVLGGAPVELKSGGVECV